MNLPAHGTTSPDPSVVSVLQQQTKQNRNNNISPDPAYTPPGKIVPDRLAVPAHRQAPAPFQCHYFLVIAWRSTPCRQAPCNAGVPLVIPTVRRHTSNSDEGLTPSKDGGTCLRRLSMFRKEVH